MMDEAREYSEALQGGERRNWINLVELANSLADAVEALEARVVELESVIRGALHVLEGFDRDSLSSDEVAMMDILSTTPPMVLADHDKEVAAHALEQVLASIKAADEHAPSCWQYGYLKAASIVRDAAAALRVADQNGEHA